MSTFLIVVIVVVALILMIIPLYNRLIRYRNNRENAFANIDVQLKQRHDLIPQLVETVRGYMKHEATTLEKITQARNIAVAAQGIDQKIAAENQLSSLLSGFRVTMEAYPDLKASANFMQLQEEMSDIENKLAAARRYFNSATKEYNNAVEVFPANIVASLFGFKRETMFDVGDEQRAVLDEPPKVSF